MKSYGKIAAVRDVSFEVMDGEIFGILGTNGAGKTTTIECLQGLRRLDGGTARVLDLDPQSRGQEVRKRIGSQLQESALPDRLKVWEAVNLFSSFSTARADPGLLVDEWGLGHRRHASFGSLSGGERQRLFIALAFVNHPELVFLDELTTGLDPHARHETWDLIRSIRERGTTVVLVTHFMDEAEALCDRVAVMDRGRIVALDTPQGIIEHVGGPIHVLFTTEREDLQWLRAIPEVSGLERRGQEVDVTGSGAVLAKVAADLVAHGVVPPDLRVRRPSLEDAFLALTQSARKE